MNEDSEDQTNISTLKQAFSNMIPFFESCCQCITRLELFLIFNTPLMNNDNTSYIQRKPASHVKFVFHWGYGKTTERKSILYNTMVHAHQAHSSIKIQPHGTCAVPTNTWVIF